MIRINLLQIREEVRRANVRNYFILSSLVLLVAFIISYSWHSGIVNDIATTKRQIQQAKTEISKIDRVIGEVEKIKQQKVALEEKLHTIQTLETNRKYLVQVFNEIARILPSDTWIKEVDIQDQEVNLSGSSVDNQLIGHFLGELDDSPLFGQIEYGPSKQREFKGGIRYFDFSVKSILQPLTAENFISDEELEAAQ